MLMSTIRVISSSLQQYLLMSFIELLENVKVGGHGRNVRVTACNTKRFLTPKARNSKSAQSPDKTRNLKSEQFQNLPFD
jgi:hypothetical protein